MIALALSVLLATPAADVSAGSDRDAHALIDAMGRAADGIRDYSMRLTRQEWHRNALGPEETVAVRWMADESYFFEVLHGEGVGRRVIFRRGSNNDRLRVRLATWPNPRVNLSPCGKTAIEGVHRPVLQSSLVYLIRAVQRNVARGRERGESRASTLGEETVLGRRCRVVEFSGPTKTRSSYTVKTGETLETIGDEHGVSVRSLLHANRAQGLASCEVHAGDRIEIPRYDASKVRLWLDAETNLPLRVTLWDDDGVLFERFEHADLKINSGLSAADFEL